MKYLFLILLSLLVLSFSCSKEKKTSPEKTLGAKSQTKAPAEISSSPKAEIKIGVEKPSSISKQNFTKTETGLKYADILKGTGKQPQAGEKVQVHYTGWLTNGKRFDSSVLRKKPFVFVIGKKQVIPGWDEGVMSMREGGVRQLVIPPQLAYGDRGIGGVIPPNATLIFEVQLLQIQ